MGAGHSSANGKDNSSKLAARNPRRPSQSGSGEDPYGDTTPNISSAESLPEVAGTLAQRASHPVAEGGESHSSDADSEGSQPRTPPIAVPVTQREPDSESVASEARAPSQSLSSCCVRLCGRRPDRSMSSQRSSGSGYGTDGEKTAGQQAAEKASFEESFPPQSMCRIL